MAPFVINIQNQLQKENLEIFTKKEHIKPVNIEISFLI